MSEDFKKYAGATACFAYATPGVLFTLFSTVAAAQHGISDITPFTIPLSIGAATVPPIAAGVLLLKK